MINLIEAAVADPEGVPSEPTGIEILMRIFHDARASELFSPIIPRVAERAVPKHPNLGFVLDPNMRSVYEHTRLLMHLLREERLSTALISGQNISLLLRMLEDLLVNPIVTAQDNQHNKLFTWALTGLSYSLNQQGVAEGYNSWANTYGEYEAAFFNMEEQYIIGVLNKSYGSESLSIQGLNVLDIGSGKGRYTIPFSLAGARVTAIDPSAGMSEHTHRMGKIPDLMIPKYVEIPGWKNLVSEEILGHYIQPTIIIDSFPEYRGLKTNSFDLVFSSLAFTHIQDLSQAVAEISRVLKPRGRALIVDINPVFKRLGSGVVYFDEKTHSMRVLEQNIHDVPDWFNAIAQTELKITWIHQFPLHNPSVQAIPYFMAVEMRKRE